MFKFETLNKERLFPIDTTDFVYESIEAAAKRYGDHIIKCNGFYVNTKGKFDDTGVAIISEEKVMVNLPKHTVEPIKQIMDNPEAVQMVNEGHCGIQFYKYFSDTYSKECYSIRFITI